MKFIRFFIIIFITLSTSIKADLNKNLIEQLEKGGKLIFIRHAYAPGSGDPDGFEISDCASQRNLSIEGINQSKKIGQFFIKNDVLIDKVLSSEWCRCKQTAEYAFNVYETKSFLNSFFSQKFTQNKNKQIKELKKYVKEWNGENNLIFVTHYVVISEVLNLSALSGEIIVSDKNFNVLIRQKIQNN